MAILTSVTPALSSRRSKSPADAVPPSSRKMTSSGGATSKSTFAPRVPPRGADLLLAKQRQHNRFHQRFFVFLAQFWCACYVKTYFLPDIWSPTGVDPVSAWRRFYLDHLVHHALELIVLGPTLPVLETLLDIVVRRFSYSTTNANSSSWARRVWRFSRSSCKVFYVSYAVVVAVHELTLPNHLHASLGAVFAVVAFDAFYQCFMFWAGLMKLNPGFPAVFSTVWRSALGSNGSLADVLLYVKRTFLDGILPNSLVPQIIGGLDVISVEFEPPVLWLDAGAGIRFAFGSWIDLDMLVSVGRSWGEIVARFFLVDPLAMAIDSLAPLVQLLADHGGSSVSSALISFLDVSAGPALVEELPSATFASEDGGFDSSEFLVFPLTVPLLVELCMARFFLSPWASGFVGAVHVGFALLLAGVATKAGMRTALVWICVFNLALAYYVWFRDRFDTRLLVPPGQEDEGQRQLVPRRDGAGTAGEEKVISLEDFLADVDDPSDRDRSRSEEKRLGPLRPGGPPASGSGVLPVASKTDEGSRSTQSTKDEQSRWTTSWHPSSSSPHGQQATRTASSQGATRFKRSGPLRYLAKLVFVFGFTLVPVLVHQANPNKYTVVFCLVCGQTWGVEIILSEKCVDFPEHAMEKTPFVNSPSSSRPNKLLFGKEEGRVHQRTTYSNAALFLANLKNGPKGAVQDRSPLAHLTRPIAKLARRLIRPLEYNEELDLDYGMSGGIFSLKSTTAR